MFGSSLVSTANLGSLVRLTLLAQKVSATFVLQKVAPHLYCKKWLPMQKWNITKLAPLCKKRLPCQESR
jgi:hypothetical protein